LLRYQTHITFLISRLKSETGKKKQHRRKTHSFGSKWNKPQISKFDPNKHANSVREIWGSVALFLNELMYLRFWNQTLICLGSMLERIGHSLISCCLLKELGLGHSVYTLSNASTCSGVYLTYLLESMCLSLLCIESAIKINKNT